MVSGQGEPHRRSIPEQGPKFAVPGLHNDPAREMALVDRVTVALQLGQFRVIAEQFGDVLLPPNIEGGMLCFCCRSLCGA